MTAESEKLKKKLHPDFVRDSSQKFTKNVKEEAISDLKTQIKKQFSEML